MCEIMGILYCAFHYEIHCDFYRSEITNCSIWEFLLHWPFRVLSSKLNSLNTVLYMLRVSLSIKIKKIAKRIYSASQ